MRKFIPAILLAFCLGWLANSLSFGLIDAQVPLGSGKDVPSPSDWLSEEPIVMKNYLLLKLPNATVTDYASTKSMDPVLDDTSLGIEIKPVKSKLKAGDIISYISSVLNIVIVHRIVAIEQDEFGTYYITKGDNNILPDVEKVRFEQIQGVVVGLLY